MIEKEKIILDKLVDIWNLFLELEKQHPEENSDFADGIHRCQYIIAMRLAGEHYPETFPIKKLSKEKIVCKLNGGDMCHHNEFGICKAPNYVVILKVTNTIYSILNFHKLNFKIMLTMIWICAIIKSNNKLGDMK